MSDDSLPGAQDTFISHLVELRNRLVKAAIAVLVVFVILFLIWPGPAAVYDFLARPMMDSLPAGAMNAQTWYSTHGRASTSATIRVSFIGTRNGVVMPVAIILAPAGSESIIGRARKS